MKKKQILLYCVLIFLALFSFRPWFLLNTLRWDWIFAPILMFYILFKRSWFNFSKDNILFICLSFFILCYSQNIHDIGGFVGTFLSSMCMFSIILLEHDYKIQLISLFDKVFAISTFISLFWWCLYLLHIPLPHYSIVFEATQDTIYNLDIYYLFSYWDRGLISDVFPRFSFVFYEPGFYSIILVFMLLYHQFNFKKKQFWIYLLALFFSFSLAGWLMFCLLWGGLSLVKSKRGIISLVLVVIVVYSFQDFFSTYNDGDNVVNNMILSRLELADGNISGYNRTAVDFDNTFSMYISDINNEWFWGASKMATAVISEQNVGWKVYWYFNGFVIFFSFLYCVYIPFRYYKREIKCLFPMILYYLMFMRGHYVIWYSGFWLVYTCTLAIIYQKEHYNIEELEEQ